MSTIRRAGSAVVAVMAMTALLHAPASAQEADGQELYDQWCAGCHGVEGDGEGPAAAWMLPRPRDFTTALYQIRTTPSGQIPTDEDILHVINEGMPGTTMPGWEEMLSNDERQALVEYVKSFSPFFESSPEPEPIDLGSAPGADDERLAEGEEVYQRIECYRCHGDFGRGDGRSAPTLEDDENRPVAAADLTQPWRFNGGSTVEDIFRTMRTGLDGTPMPSQSDLIQGGVITEDELWSLAHYVRSLAPEQAPPPLREVVQAQLVEEGESLPTSVDDERWETVDRFYIPLVGQIIEDPRWFEPQVTTVWVQALHDGEELALRLSWSDPSESPDPEWVAEWQPRILDALEPARSEGVEAEPRPDRIAVQFPTEMPEGNRRPYFLMGDESDPVYLWSWDSESRTGREVEARGLENRTDHPEENQNLTSDAVWQDGQWQVLFRRPIEAAEDAGEIGFTIGDAVPIAFFAWDGDNGEDGTRGAVSSWYFVSLREATPARVYVAPVAAMALTALLGVGIVFRAQRREGRKYSESGDEARAGDGEPTGGEN